MNCGSSKYSLVEKKQLDPLKGIIAFQVEYINDEGGIAPLESWWMYPLYFIYGPPYLDVFVDHLKTNLKVDSSGFVAFEYPAGEIPRNDSFKLEIRQFIFFKPTRIASAYFNKSEKKVVLEAKSITVLPKVQINVARNIYKTVPDDKDREYSKLLLQEKYKNLMDVK